MFVLDLRNVSKKDSQSAGGKGASLGELIKVGILVPRGFVVLSDAYLKFIRENDLDSKIKKILDSIDYKNLRSVKGASKKIKDIAKKGRVPEDVKEEVCKHFTAEKFATVAVRSSATTEDSRGSSWAGQFESYLNISRSNLIESIKKVWLSLFSPRAILYHLKKGKEKREIAMAVVVQEMVQSEISGACFTVDPVTQNRRYLLIETVQGAGEGLVGGRVTPDSYSFDKKEGILNKRSYVFSASRRKQILTVGRIERLAGICIDIEKQFKRPQDIEWSFSERKFYFLQSRPITTLGT